MSAQEKQSRIFSYLQEAKLEMSRKEVQGLLEKLPHLPMPKGGHPISIRIGLTFKSIIMNSILIISVLSGLMYFSQLDEEQNISTEVVFSEESSSEAELPYREIDTREIESFESLDLDQENLAEVQAADSESVEPIASPEENTSQDEKESKEVPAKEEDPISDSKEEAAAEEESPGSLDKSEANRVEESERMKRSFRGTTYYHHNSPVKISEADIKLLKKDLLKQLKADGFAKGRKVRLAIQCLPDGLRINSEQLTKTQAAPYEAFLQQYSIPTATQRQIRLIDKFILIGDFNKEGDMLRGTLQGSGNIVLDELDPIEEYYPLFSDKEEKALTLDDGPCEKPLNVEDNITQLKNKLKSRLKSDELFSPKKGETRIWFPKEGIAMNDQLIPDGEKGDYLELLREYGIEPCSFRIVQFTNKYIAVGDIVEGRFRGRIHGGFDVQVLNNIKLKESINK